MAQDRISGAAGRAYGLRTGRIIAHLLGAEKIGVNANEAIWQGRRVVIKACSPANTNFGVTATMLPRLDAVLVAIEQGDGSVTVRELAVIRFQAEMRDSRSASATGGRVKMVSRKVAEVEGAQVAHFLASDIIAADAASA